MALVGFALPVLLSTSFLFQAPTASPALQVGTVEGAVLALPDSLPIAGALIQVGERGESAVTDAGGRFTLVLPPGSYRLLAEAYGFTPTEVPGVTVTEGAVSRITLLLAPRPFELAEIVVSPSSFGILREGLVPGRTLTRQEVEASPHMGTDLFRAMNRLPGIATHDISAKLQVRGGPDTQVLTTLDGLELYEPYHMKYWDGSLSVVDPEAVGSVDLYTGGFSAEYGDRLTGVLSMKSRAPEPELRTALGVSATNASFLSSGGFADGRGSWLFLARQGFLKYVFAVTGVDNGGELKPTYYDVFGKTSFQAAPGQIITAHLLHTGETLRAVEDDSTLIRGKYGSSYGWLTWDANLGRALSIETILSAGEVDGDRRGEDEEGGGQALSVREQKSFTFQGIAQKWSYQPGDRLLLRWGGEVKSGEAKYSYFRRGTSWRPNLSHYTAPPWSLELDRVALTPRVSGTEASVFLLGRIRVLDHLTTEVGLRYDDISHTGDRTLSPRVGAVLELAAWTTLRGAWGHYYQSQGVHELAVADGDTAFYPAARAEHRILGLEHGRPSGTIFTVEAYQRLVRDPLPEYRSLVPEIEGLWEESLSDRVRLAPTRARAEGIEFMARGPLGNRASWSASYALASSEERIQGEWVPRPTDQRHTLNLEMSVRPISTLSLGWGWSYHSPWPYTGISYEVVPVMNGDGQVAFLSSADRLYDRRMPAYHRLDIRVTKRFGLKRGSLFVYLDVFNAYNRDNPYSVKTRAFWNPSSQGPEYLDEIEPQLGVLPTLGIRWEF